MSFTGLVRAASCWLGGAVVAVVIAGPASAGSESVRDPGGDVLSGPYFSDDLPRRPEPARRAGDIVRTKVVLGTDLVVTTKYRSLTTGPIELDFSWFIRTPEEGSPWSAQLSVAQQHGGEHFFLADSEANQPDCGDAEIDRRARTVTLTVSADCLGNPAWVRIGNGAMFAVEPTRTYYDDARRDGHVGRSWTWGAKVTAS
jgi:hypothetical protein